LRLQGLVQDGLGYFIEVSVIEVKRVLAFLVAAGGGGWRRADHGLPP
jgi:hypothetical protein